MRIGTKAPGGDRSSDKSCHRISFFLFSAIKMLSSNLFFNLEAPEVAAHGEYLHTNWPVTGAS
jgi:hypothetical protein